MTSSTPREVNGKWYPVPCPEGVSIGQSFPSYETCLAACETSNGYDLILDDERTRFDEKLGAESEESYGNGMHDGRHEGRADHIHEECEEGTCPGYDVGYKAGYARHADEVRARLAALLPRSAETA